MGKIKLLNTNNNSYFENNQIDISDSVPTEGNHVVGDIVIKETQVEHMAIGWICIEAGNPGVWSEFGGMIENDEPIVLDPESVGMNELNSEVKSKLLLGDSIVVNVQALQSAVANCATKEDLKNIDLSLYATKEDLENIDLSLYATKEELKDLSSDDIMISESANSHGRNLSEELLETWRWIQDIDTLAYENKAKIGESDLQTTDKTITGAINELFQCGNNVKQNLVDTLVAKGVECSTSNSFEEIINKIESSIIAPSWATGVGLPCAAAEMTTGRRFLTSAVLGNNIYAIGGYTGSTSNVNEMYDTVTNTWTTKKVLSVSTYGGAAVGCNGSIHHLGGYSYTTSHYMYNPSTNTWTGKTALPNAKQYSAAVEVDGKVYISQGNNTYNIVYDPSTNAWTQLTRNGTTGGNYVSSAYYNGKIYVMGGASYPTYAYSYDIANDTWATIASIPTGFYRAGQHGMVYKDKIYFMGGTYNSSTSNKILQYDPVANSWELLPITLPIAVYGPTTQIVNGRMYCIGGYYNTYMKTNQMLLL